MRKLRIIFLFMLMLLVLSIKAFAYNIDVKSIEEIKAGEKLEVIVQLEAIEEEIDIYSGVFQYNKDDFEEITEDNFELQDGWETLYYNKENGIFIVERKNKTKNNTKIFKINLITRKNLNKETIEILLKDNMISGGINDVKTEDKKITVKVKKDEVNNEFAYKIKDNYITGIATKTPIGDFKDMLANKNEYEIKIKKDDKEINSGYVSTGMKIYIKDKSNVYEYDAVVKGDVNCDGIANSQDTQLIKGYRNETVKLMPVQIISADINEDGKINRADSKLLLYHRANVRGYDLNYKK